MENNPTLMRMCVALAFLLSFTSASEETSCGPIKTSTCQRNSNSGADVHCESDSAPHSCSNRNEDKEKLKYHFHVNEPLKFRGVYPFPVDPIPRRNCFDKEAMEFLQKGLPVVLEQCTFQKPALKWTIEYLKENLKDEDHTAYFSQTRQFLYYDDDHMKGTYKEWKPPITKKFLYFSNFTKLMKEIEEADNGSRAYFQSLIYLQEGVSAAMQNDIDSFNYTWLLDLVTRFSWGEDVTNLLLVGMPDVVTPAHFDVLENLYVQIFGRKRVILFSPDYFRCLYPHPVGHPHDRQTQVDFDKPNFDWFPRFREIRGMEVALEPGEVLYIPNLWWHYIESEMHSNTISINFWFEAKNASKVDDARKKKTNATDIEAENNKESHQEYDNPRENKEQPEDSEETLKEHSEETGTSNSEQISEHSDESKADETMAKGTEEEKDGKEFEETDLNQEEEGVKEIELSAAEYLILLRETEISLYKATLSHAKVKKILDELLSGRFDHI